MFASTWWNDLRCDVRSDKTTLIVVLCSAWWFASVVVILLLKLLVSNKEVDFPYPFTVSGIINIVTSVLAYMCSRADGNRKQVDPAFRLNIFSLPVIAIGLVQGFELGASNKVLQLMSVSDRQMTSAINPLIMFAMSLFLRLEVFSLSLLATMTLICIGGVISNNHFVDGGLSFLVLCVAAIASLLSAFRWACTQTLLQRDRYTNSIELVALVSPYTACCCFVVSFFFEKEAYSLATSSQHQTVFGWNRTFMLTMLLGIVSLSVFVLMACEFKLVKSTSALAMSVFQSMHNFFIIMSGIIFYGDSITWGRLFGYGLSQVGVICYVVLRNRKSDDSAQEWLLEASNRSIMSTESGGIKPLDSNKVQKHLPALFDASVL